MFDKGLPQMLLRVRGCWNEEFQPPTGLREAVLNEHVAPDEVGVYDENRLTWRGRRYWTRTFACDPNSTQVVAK